MSKFSFITTQHDAHIYAFIRIYFSEIVYINLNNLRLQENL